MSRRRSSSSDNQELVDNLQRTLGDLSPKVINVMRRVDRANYMVDSSRPLVDRPEVIDYGQTISAPHMHAYALQLLKDHLVEGSRALDVGSGSGYITATMGLLVGSGGRVVGIEHFPELAQLSIENIKRDQPELLDSGRLKIVVGDGIKGYQADAPYDAIHVGAAAETIPEALIDQLRPGGRMIIPLGPSWLQELLQVDKDQDGRVTRKNVIGVAFVPLTNKVEY